jgi:hypothetical protein
VTEHDADGYTGTATLVVETIEIPVEVDLRGHFQPIDGYYRWYGRIMVNEQVTAISGGKKVPVEIRTPTHSANGEISDPDPWGRYRIMGTSTPPFPVPISLDEVDA